ncbi:MAG: SRPBCC family protein [Komarekiella atlantica HA4396-MV6]|jgi:hypothetical protein|nr:SRPBCC family protein [Komarekiella atlantica HA4396-MV6]
MSKDSIRWPAEYDPSRCLVYVVNSLDIAASPAIVWEQLIAATDWSSWNPNLSNVYIKDGSRNLSQNAEFTWKASGATTASTVKEFVPNQRLAWDAKGFGLRAYHAWLIIPTTQGCRVLSEETLRGTVACLLKLFTPNLVSYLNQQWLEGLAKKAEQPLAIDGGLTAS